MTVSPDGKLKALLRRRPALNQETEEAETYPGATQVTVHGGVESTDASPQAALMRETTEELGELAAVTIKKLITESPGSLIEVSQFQTGDKTVITYAIKLPWSLLTQLFNIEEMNLVTEADLNKIADLRNFDKTTGVQDKSVIAMFGDEKEALNKAFKLFS